MAQNSPCCLTWGPLWQHRPLCSVSHAPRSESTELVRPRAALPNGEGSRGQMLLPLPSGERSPGRDILWDRGPPAAKPSCLHILWAATLTALPHSALLESAPEETTRPFLRLGLLEDTDQEPRVHENLCSRDAEYFRQGLGSEGDLT